MTGRFYRNIGKRLFDFTVALLLLLALLPFLLLLAIAVRLKLGSPVLFRQIRPGLLGRPFMLLKFRTMTNRCDSVGTLLSDAERLSRFGRFLRCSSMDELPELFNVLRGDMSLVGPRPLLVRYLDRYTPEEMRRHEVKPGITGWAQVSGRNALSWEQKFQHDVWYVNHLTFFVDLKILALTVRNIFKREGISQPGHATMEEFRR